MVPALSQSRAWGAISASPKARAMSKMACCSSLSAKSMGLPPCLPTVEMNARLIIGSAGSVLSSRAFFASRALRSRWVAVRHGYDRLPSEVDQPLGSSP
jgi:hypothetical protein